jgi:SAM-dependent methyltransferase
MPTPNDVYTKCDELENLPAQNRQNWLYEIELLRKEIPLNASVLQVGCMDGTRILKLLQERPDLHITGLEIESVFIPIAQAKIADAKFEATFLLGDITAPPPLPVFDYVICLNNTLGYIPDEEKAMSEMRKLGKKVIISVYGEKFTNELAHEYFKAINLSVEKIEGDCFYMKDFSSVKRYTKSEIKNWGGKIIETPIGYFCIL